MNLNIGLVILTVLSIIMIDIMCMLNISPISSALPVFLFQLYSLNKEGRVKKEDEREGNCEVCMEKISKCKCNMEN